LGPEAFVPAYHTATTLPHAYPAKVRRQALAMRQKHPTWGADLIRVALREQQPRIAWPCASTLRRWFHNVGLGPAPRPQRPRRHTAKATEAHHTWQIDASERIPLANGKLICWLRVADEASGAVLGTVIFPPSLLEPGRAEGYTTGLAQAV